MVDVIQALAGDDAGLAKLARIRLGSVEPTTLTARFVEAVASLPKCCPHFHVSLQSGCDSTLGRMNRKYSTLEYSNAVARLRAKVKDVALTTDIIVGFPGETDSDFEESLEFVRQIGFAAVHVFPFSPRKGTVAAKMSDQIAPEIKARRSERMIALATELSRTFHEHMLGREWDVLIEEKDADGRYIGHTGNFTKCACVRAQEICGAPQTLAAGISHGEGVIGEIVRVKAVGIEGDKIVGNLVEDDES